MSSQGFTQLTDRLVNAGRIARKNDSQDRRIIRLFITAEGEKELAQMREKYDKKMNSFLSLIPEQDLKELVRIQSELVQKLEKQNK